MLLPHLETLNILSTPVWVVSAHSQHILFANTAARKLAGNSLLGPLRNGQFSVHSQLSLESYLPNLAKDDQIVEIWTIHKEGRAFPLSCRLSSFQMDTNETVIVFEGAHTSAANVPMPIPGDTPYRRDESGFYERLFQTNTAPMLLIDPANNGQIVDANQAATRFYGYTRDEMCTKHTWEINAMGLDVLPVMHEISRLPGGHKPLTFVHKLADGNLRHVQTYAGPVELNGVRLMLCIIHDITEQKRLEQELEHAALRDPLTGLGNRRQFMQLVENARTQNPQRTHNFSLMLVDADHFKAINDEHGHNTGDDALIMLARTLETGIRESDTVFRWGGEEFLILLPLTPLEGAMHVAEDLREAVQQLSRPGLPALTVSVGVAQYEAGEDFTSLFKRVDDALYRAKTSGRNQVQAG
ncbi:MAG: sensor domain-containing diguanylate cyclase [Rahnella inusitata]|jgi:diguanylate cyclase (GGDEF)-like protein/PAS domain S-box-containing protein|uniref:sensor domain-containing diguanylate cyclase n=1 Tax=Rahnella inusitata TaxID=58169 RepID=UPI00183156D1|nr:sensor domain-containing diguanylate cyclase [Rahnella inusitata]NMC23859.1 diguanylate cyclase [Serratia sp. (in: enterobacteria)]QUT14626.1 GGDEF domain-containing protein [Rahnella inusitata]